MAVLIGISYLLRSAKARKSVAIAWTRFTGRSEQKTASSTEGQTPSSFNFHVLKRDIDFLKESVNILIDRFSGVQTALSNMQVDLHDLKERLRTQGQQDRRFQPEKVDSGDSRSSIDSPRRFPSETSQRDYSKSFSPGNVTERYSEITALYNVARDDHASRARFREKYKPFFINVTNDVERRRDSTLPPDFRKGSDGSYLAVPENSNETIVFPDFTLVIVDAVYGPGGLVEVFECPDYDRGSSYPSVRVARPAIFKLQGGDSWVVDKKGVLELGQGQDS